MDQHETHRRSRRPDIALVAFFVIGGYFLWTGHRAHVVEFLPWLLLIGCCAMHFFMHRGHGGHGASHEPESRRRDEPGAGP